MHNFLQKDDFHIEFSPKIVWVMADYPKQQAEKQQPFWEAWEATYASSWYICFDAIWGMQGICVQRCFVSYHVSPVSILEHSLT